MSENVKIGEGWDLNQKELNKVQEDDKNIPVNN